MHASTGAFDYSSSGFVCQNSNGNVNAMVPAQHSPRYWYSGSLRNMPPQERLGNAIGAGGSPVILSKVSRSMILTCPRSRILMTPRVVRVRNARLTAASVVPMYSPMSERSIGR